MPLTRGGKTSRINDIRKQRPILTNDLEDDIGFEDMEVGESREKMRHSSDRVLSKGVSSQRIHAERSNSEDNTFTSTIDRRIELMQADYDDYLSESDSYYSDKPDDENEQRESEEPVSTNDKNNTPNLGLKEKKTREPVCCREIIDLAPGEKLHIEFNKDCQPVGKYAKTYKSFLGQTVRNRSCCSLLKVQSWGEISDDQKDFIWEIILEKFSFDVPHLRKEYILRHMGNLYRYYRHKLKANYFDYDKKNEKVLKTLQERMKNKPLKMPKQDWEYLCKLWSSPNFQDKSGKAKENRALQKMPHYSGSKSYAQIKEELKKVNNRDPSRAEVLIEARKRKKETPVAAETLANNNSVVEKIKKLREERQEGQNNMSDDQILEEVIGVDKHGYLRGYGPGKTITEYHGVKPSRIDLAEQVVELEQKAKEKEDEAKKLVDDAKTEFEEKLVENNQMWTAKWEQNEKKNGKKDGHKYVRDFDYIRWTM